MIDRGPAWLVGVADAMRIPLGNASVDLVLGSPPYGPQRTYGISAVRDLEAWVAWMLGITAEALRVSRGLVLWVVAGWTTKVKGGSGLGCYQPGPELLLGEWVRRGGFAWRPNFWHRSGVPGSGHKAWYRGDVEYVLAFKRPGSLPFADPLVNGKPPAYAHSGPTSNRRKDGLRQNRGADGVTRPKAFKHPEIADPGNLFRTQVGRNHMGDHRAHENEAPFPEAVPERFILSHSPPGGLILDPFSGSGSALAAAHRAGRRGIGLDLRPSQARLAMQRLSRPHAPAPRASARNGHAPAPLFDRLEDTPC
jgi:hypothetical protein